MIVTQAIIAEISTAIEKLGGDASLLGTINSWGEKALTDEDVLEFLRAWNAEHGAEPEEHFLSEALAAQVAK